ncbi:MAG: ribosome biogenesis GTP-binding protein YihA/YsxC [Syntrophothermus sp.]
MTAHLEAEFVTSASAPDQYPRDGLPEIALAGRSNVGKSSLINAVTGMKLAKTSTEPGRTRRLNFYRVAGDFYLVDLPGYGFAKVSKEEKARWGQMVEEYLLRRPNLVGVIHLVDLRRPVQGDDLQLRDWLALREVPILLVATKADKLSKGQKIRADREISVEFGAAPVLFSARTGEGREQVRHWLILQAKAAKF